MVIMAARLAVVVFAAAVTVSHPPLVTAPVVDKVSQVADFVADHVAPSVVVAVNTVVSPPAPGIHETRDGSIRTTPAGWVTVTVFDTVPAVIVTVPVRELVVVFASVEITRIRPVIPAVSDTVTHS
jgi:hypothetical protein